MILRTREKHGNKHDLEILVELIDFYRENLVTWQSWVSMLVCTSINSSKRNQNSILKMRKEKLSLFRESF